MKYYEKLLQLGCFTYNEAVDIVGLENTTKSLLQQYIKKGYIIKVKRGLYTTVNLLDHEPIANKYVIGSKITETSLISHHSAFEFYGFANQVSYDVTVTSKSRFSTFYFNEFRYHRFNSEISSGIINKNGIRITDIERTIIDSINNFDKDMGFEELIKCINAIPGINEKKLLTYLDEYNKCFLYQKTGFIFEHLKEEFNISDEFLEICKTKAESSSRYLMKELPTGNISFNNHWHLTIPQNLWLNVLNGGDVNADV